MAAINNNNYELFTFMTEFMLEDSDDEFFVLYRSNSMLELLIDCAMPIQEMICPNYMAVLRI